MSWPLLLLLLLGIHLLLQLPHVHVLFLLLHLALQSSLLGFSHLVILLLLSPVRKVSYTLHVLLGQPKELQGSDQELPLTLYVTAQLIIISGVL